MSSGSVDADRLDFDVAIAGAGLAGSSLALRLARAGAKVALVDPGQFPRDKLCGEYLSPEGAAALERLGLCASLTHAGVREIRQVLLTTPRGRSLRADVTGESGRPGLGLSRSAMDSLLVDECRKAGVWVFESTRVSGPKLQEGRVVGLIARDLANAPREFDAAITVAANGRHSALVKQTGTTRTRSWWRPGLFGLKRHFRGAEPPDTQDAVALHMVPGGYIGTSQVEGGLTNLCGLLPESILKRHRGDLDALAEEHFARNPFLHELLQTSSAAGPWKTVAGVRVEVSSPRVPGIVYAGDCQGTVDPLGGQGMTMALLGAEMLAPRVLAALASDGMTTRAQEALQNAWRRRFDGRIRLCRAFHHVLVNPSLVDAASRFQGTAPRVLMACYNLTRDRIEAAPT